MSPPAADAIIGSMNVVSIEPRISIAKVTSLPVPDGATSSVRVRADAAHLALDGQSSRRVVCGHGQRRIDALAHQLRV